MLTGFDNDLFLPIFLTGWIVVVVYQTAVSKIYVAPKNYFLAFALLVLPILFLVVNSFLKELEVAIIFIELALVDLFAMVVALNYAIIHKAIKEGVKGAPVFAILFTMALFSTAGFYLVKFLLRFFEAQNFDWLTITLISLIIIKSSVQLSYRMAAFTSFASSSKNNSENSSIRFEGGAEKEFSASEILITLGIWFVIIPLLTFLYSLI